MKPRLILGLWVGVILTLWLLLILNVHCAPTGLNTFAPYGLVGWWTLNDGTATDFSGLANSGSLSNAPTVTNAVAGNGLRFNGTTQLVAMPNAAQYAFGTGDFSVAIWVKFEDFVTDQNGFFSKDDYAGGSSYKGWLMNLSVPGGGIGISTRKVVSGSGPDFSCRYATNNFTVGLWYNLIATRTSNVLRLYVNGVLKTNTTETTPVDVTNTEPISLARLSASSPQWFSGVLDDARIYNRALTAEDVAVLYNGGAATRQ